MKKIIHLPWLAVALVIPLSTFPTCIVVVKWNNQIFVAADTKKTYDFGQPDETVSKIKHSGKYYYVTGGAITQTLYALCDSILIENISSRQKIEKIGKTLCWHLDTLLNDREHVPKERYERVLKGEAMKIAVFYSESGVLRIDVIDYKLKPFKEAYKTKDSIRFDVPNTYLGYYELLGTPQELAIHKYKPQDYAIFFIEMEMDNNHKNEVGFPIERLMMNPDGQVQPLPKVYTYQPFY